MTEDIRISLSFKDNRKRKKLFKKLGAAGVLSLIDLWISVAENRPDGILKDYNEDDIEIDANWDGEPGEFVKALIDCRFLDVDESGFKMHNWRDRQSWVFGSGDRSDKARFSILAKTHKAIFEKLKAEGVNAITKAKYIELTSAQRTVNDSLTPYPSPSPSPSPSPLPN